MPQNLDFDQYGGLGGFHRLSSAFITFHVVFLGAPLPTMNAIAGIGLVDYYGKVPIYRKCSTLEAEKKQENLTIQAEKVLPRPPPPTLQGPSTAPAGPILLKFWLKTRKSILNKVNKFKIPTPNRLGARIKKTPGGRGAESAPPARNRVKQTIQQGCGAVVALVRLAAMTPTPTPTPGRIRIMITVTLSPRALLGYASRRAIGGGGGPAPIRPPYYLNKGLS